MVFSLNAAITEVGLLSVLILYALSYLGSFIDHSHHYHIQNYRTEEYLSNIGIGLSIILLGLCLFVPLNFLDMNIVNVGLGAEIQIQSAEQAFWGFHTINVKGIIRSWGLN